MKIKNDSYTPEFKEILSYCEHNHFFLGEGNPNSKILLVGKEIGGEKPFSLDEIKEKSNCDIKRNIASWLNPDGYDSGKLKADVLSCDIQKLKRRNPTWANYQKLVCRITGNDLGIDNYNFLDYCFMTELSQIHLHNSNYGKHLTSDENREINALKKSSVQERSKLFSMPFFSDFPIVIMACGHYPKTLGFNIEETFGVKWVKEESKSLSKGNFYNVHYRKSKNGRGRILIHTRQVSNGVSNQLLSEIADLCSPFWK